MKKIALFVIAAALTTSVVSSCSKSKTCTCNLKVLDVDTTFKIEFDNADQAKSSCEAADKQYRDMEVGSCEL